MKYFSQTTDPRDCLLRFWVLKEAYAKLTGRGWGSYLQDTCFSPDDPRIQVIDGCYVAILEENEQLMNNQVSLVEKKAIDYVDKHFWYEDLNENCFNKIIKAYIAGAKEYEQLYNDIRSER